MGVLGGGLPGCPGLERERERERGETLSLPPDAPARRKACAKVLFDLDHFLEQANRCALGEPGHKYAIECDKINAACRPLRKIVGGLVDDENQLRQVVGNCRDAAIGAITAIPTEIGSEVLEAHSPFQAYCKLKAFCEATTLGLVWADPYMGPGLFHRYLNSLPQHVHVALVTKDRGNAAEYQDFLDISRLYAQERGPDKYRLVTEQTFHDRYLGCDDQLYHLGGSAKDAGRKSPFTITKMEPIPENFQTLADLLAVGTQLFGPNTPVHP